jgi:hypothetical protein
VKSPYQAAIALARAQGALQALSQAHAALTSGADLTAMLAGCRAVLSDAESAWAAATAEQAALRVPLVAEVTLPEREPRPERPRVRAPGRLRVSARRVR